ncbi:MAG: HAD-IA family hydrolase [Planctomycetota bacterium]
MTTTLKPIETVLFDLDGTLIDSIRLILDSYHHTLAAHGKPAQSDAELLIHVGTPLARHLAHYSSVEEEIRAMVDTYRGWNLAHHDGAIRPFEGAIDAVRALVARGRRLGVVTSKLSSSARRGLVIAGYCAPASGDAPFEVLVGSDDVAVHKPDPAPLLAALQALGVSAERAAYVGDSPYDLMAAQAAGMRAVAAGWGPFAPELLAEVGYDTWLEHPAQLAQL